MADAVFSPSPGHQGLVFSNMLETNYLESKFISWQSKVSGWFVSYSNFASSLVGTVLIIKGLMYFIMAP